MRQGPAARHIYPESIPLGVADRKGRIGAVACDRDDIDLLDLCDGALARRLHGLGTPLMIDEGHLVGWQAPDPGAARIRLFRISLAEPGEVRWSPPAPTPSWLAGKSARDPDFRLAFMRCGDAYRLYWKARDRYRDGAPPPPHRLAQVAANRAAERIDFDVGTLKIVAHRREDGFSEAEDRTRRGEQLARTAGGLTYRQAGRLHNAPWMTAGGERYVRAAVQADVETESLAIARTDGHEPVQMVPVPIDMLADRPPELSLDGRHLAVASAPGDGARRFLIYDTMSGEEVGAVPYRAGFGAFRLFDLRLICLVEDIPAPVGIGSSPTRQLCAFDIKQGQPIWCHDLPRKASSDGPRRRP